jgi:hypothetical protein
LGSTYAATPIPGSEPPAANPDLAFQVACLAALGTVGCDFQQPLRASSKAVSTEVNSDFLRGEALLAVVVVSDEDDCSIRDGALFNMPEMSEITPGEPHYLNVVCGRYDGELPSYEVNFLFDPSYFKDRYLQAKGDQPGSVVFAAIVGVPPVAACQGRGGDISTCLDHENMQVDRAHEMLETTASGFEVWAYPPACTLTDDLIELAKARPGRRYVHLAQEFGNSGYISSICNADWTPAMLDIATLILEHVEQ